MANVTIMERKVCTIINKNGTEWRSQREVSFADGVKIKSSNAELLPTTHEAGMMWIIYGEMLFTVTKNTWIGDSGAFCHITKNNWGFYDIININESAQENSGSIQ